MAMPAEVALFEKALKHQALDDPPVGREGDEIDAEPAASGGQDGAVRLWEAPSGRLLATLPGHTGGALGVVLSEDGQLVVSETAITRMNPKSFVARITKTGSDHKVLAVVLNDGTPIKSVEVKVDDGAWQAAKMDPATNGKYSWKLFNYTWTGATPGEHTLVSRVIDVTGKVQPTEKELEDKKTFLEDNAQYPRKVMVS